ncbi:MAG TPA: lipase family protein [Acidimicrobiales bacterium]|nr:lipase family protein [Acidimicrobiales bacterium]
MSATRLRGRAVALILALLAGTVSLASPASAAVPAPKGLPGFYSVPSTIPSKPGSVIKYQKITDTSVTGTTYRVMYTSLSVTNKPVAVTGLIFVPQTQPPAGGFPVVSWGHGTNGMADLCAPSLHPTYALPAINGVLAVDKLLADGWVVTASDYQGEGTPGILPYLVGVSAARNTIDIVRAARHIGAVHASSDYVVWGHSEGGQTAMFSLHIGPSYAPDLHLKGVVAGAPPSQFAVIYQFLTTSPYRFYLFMAGIAWNAAYGSARAPLSEILTPTAIKLAPVVNKGCFNYLETTIDKYSLVQIVKANPFDEPGWKEILASNDPENFTSINSVPLLIAQGGNDEQIPVVSTQLLATHLCSLGQDLERWIYPGQSHAGVITPYFGDMVQWIRDRFAGDPNPDPYQPVGLPGIQTTTCPS